MPTILILLAILSCWILLFPYPATLFLAICISVLSLPFYEYLREKFSQVKAIIIFTLTIVFSLILPISTVALMVTPQAINGVRLLQQWRDTGWEIPPQVQEYITLAESWLSEIPEITHFIADIEANINQTINTIVSYLLSGVAGFAGGIFNFLWHLFLFVILTVTCVMYAKEIKEIASRIIHYGEGMLDRFLVTIRAALRSVVMGILLVALFQGLACTLGFVIFQVPEPFFWGLLACLVAPIPFIGTALVWVPLSFVLWFIVSPFMALGLVAWGMLVVAAVDNFLRPYFLSKGIDAPFFVLLLSILCGLAVFGAAGLIAGPVIIAFAIQCVREAARIYGLKLPEPVNAQPQKHSSTKVLLRKFFGIRLKKNSTKKEPQPVDEIKENKEIAS